MSDKTVLTGIIALILGIALVFTALLAPAIMPSIMAPEAYSDRNLTKEEQERIHLRIDIRKSLIDWAQIIFTAATAAGLIGTLWYTAKNYRVASENLRVTEYSKFSEAYFKAVEMLGNKD